MKQLMVLLLVCSIFLGSSEAEARKRRRRHSLGPPPTHPVLLWSRTLSTSTDREQRKIAAFKLSQYSQSIFQEEAIQTLTKCIGDPDVEIKVLCAKAMGHAGNQGQTLMIRKLLIDSYKKDPSLHNTLVRALMTRQDTSVEVQDLLRESLKRSQDVEGQLTLLKYFELYGDGSNRFVDVLVGTYRMTENPKVRNAVVTALTARAQGQDSVIALFSSCVDSPETTLVLNCLAGLQQQGRKDARAWSAVEKTIDSDDPDVLTATLDVINALPEGLNVKVAKRLVRIIDQVDDVDTEEKAVLALGVCGDKSQSIVDVLQRLLEKTTTEEGSRIAAALVLGKQASQFPSKPRETLTNCSKKEPSQSLRTACQLGLQELESRKTLNAQNPTAAKSADPGRIPSGDAKAPQVTKSDNNRPAGTLKAEGEEKEADNAVDSERD